jgi:hypothetical protein
VKSSSSKTSSSATTSATAEAATKQNPSKPNCSSRGSSGSPFDSFSDQLCDKSAASVTHSSVWACFIAFVIAGVLVSI